MSSASGMYLMSAKADQTPKLLAGKIPTLRELEQVEKSALQGNGSGTTVLELLTALREVMQAKENAIALAEAYKKMASKI